ncbi:MAG TPA: LON peptidase substrate-binding domain-containing protein [Burkholderiales bacterium]|nr:LON peptidase substrate-binding domain-containing protein [Burkholderiales bacterium]
MATPGRIPLFPLDTVLFPGGLLPLRIFEQRYLAMAKECLRDERPFGVCLIREGAEVGAPATPEEVGCLARIVNWDMQQLGLLQIVVQGAQRFRVLAREDRSDGLVVASVEPLPEEIDSPVPEELSGARRLLERIAAEHGERLFAKPFRFESCVWVGARLAEVLPLPLESKQRLLELGDGPRRLEILQRLLTQTSAARGGSGEL